MIQNNYFNENPLDIETFLCALSIARKRGIEATYIFMDEFFKELKHNKKDIDIVDICFRILTDNNLLDEKDLYYYGETKR